MIKQGISISNGVSKPLIYGSTAIKPVKTVMLAQNSYHPNISINLKPISIDLCKTRWFFGLLLSLVCIAVFNLGTTLWIINVLQLTNNGLGYGSLILSKKGISIKSDVKFDQLLDAKIIKGINEKQNINLFFDRDTNQILLKNNEFLDNSLSLGNGKLEIQASNFQIRSTNIENGDKINDILFNIKPTEITTYTQNLISPNLGGYKIINTLETDAIRGAIFHDLRLDSRTRGVEIEAKQDISLESKGGDIQLISLNNIKFTANNAVIFNTKRLEFKNLKKSEATKMQNKLNKAYQLCVCESGQLFAVSYDSACVDDLHNCQSNQDEENLPVSSDD